MYTRVELQNKRYGKCLSSPNGTPYNPKHCCETVVCSHDAYLSKQCSRKNGHGPDELYCKQHAGKLSQPQ